jgi:Tfp pilus assembly protein PilP
VHSDKVPRLVRVLIVLLLLAGTVWSGYLLKEMVKLVREEKVPQVPESQKVDQEIARLQSVVESFESAVMARSGSTQLSVLAATISRKPFVPPPPPAMEPAEDAAALAKEQLEPPPYVEVRAIMVKGPDAVAVLDIEGEGNGIVVKKGGTFGNGKGRVVRITAEKVVFTWAGQSVESAIGM